MRHWKVPHKCSRQRIGGQQIAKVGKKTPGQKRVTKFKKSRWSLQIEETLASHGPGNGWPYKGKEEEEEDFTCYATVKALTAEESKKNSCYHTLPRRLPRRTLVNGGALTRNSGSRWLNFNQSNLTTPANTKSLRTVKMAATAILILK